jgi:DNA-binding Xre family transcriptional regulator
MNKKAKPSNVKSSKKVTPEEQKSTVETFVDSLSPSELKKFKAGYRDFALSELILALMEQDEVSVRKLAEIAEVSPSVVQAMRSGMKKDFTMQSFFKILKGLGCKKLMVEFKGEMIPLEIPSSMKK